MSTFSVRVNTLTLSGSSGSVVRGVTKFVIHPSYVPSTNVSISITTVHTIPKIILKPFYCEMAILSLVDGILYECLFKLEYLKLA